MRYKDAVHVPQLHLHSAQFEDDWSTVLWDKIDYLAGLGLTPWYAGGCNGRFPCQTCSIAPRSPYPQNCSACTVCDEAEWRQQQPASVRATMTAAQLGADNMDGADNQTQVRAPPGQV